ncbi:MAG: twin-arginine translocase subunit TatC [Thermomicrobiales bacterium]
MPATSTRSGQRSLIGRTSGLVTASVVGLARAPGRFYGEMRDTFRTDLDEPDVFAEMTLTEHLVELRNRIMTIVFGLLPCFIIGFMMAGRILDDIRVKANATQGLDIRSPTEPVMMTFKIASYVAVALGMPLIVYELVAFLAPGLTRREKRVVFTALPFVTLLFLGGAGYGYFLAAPGALKFLSTWNSGAILWQPDAPEVVSFFLTLMIGLGIAFQLPVVMFVLAKIGIFPAHLMRKWRKYAILLITVAAAVITPSTDPFNMMVVAVPLWLLYELGIIIARVFAKNPMRGAHNLPFLPGNVGAAE